MKAVAAKASWRGKTLFFESTRLHLLIPCVTCLWVQGPCEQHANNFFLSSSSWRNLVGFDLQIHTSVCFLLRLFEPIFINTL